MSVCVPVLAHILHKLHFKESFLTVGYLPQMATRFLFTTYLYLFIFTLGKHIFKYLIFFFLILVFSERWPTDFGGFFILFIDLFILSRRKKIETFCFDRGFFLNHHILSKSFGSFPAVRSMSWIIWIISTFHYTNINNCITQKRI